MVGLTVKWSEQFLLREKVHQRYPDLWHLKVVRKRVPFLLKHLKDGESVLEVGAFNRDLGEKMKIYLPRTTYKSMDIDPAYPHDYSSFDEIGEKFDMILLFEVIEHLGLEEGREMVKRVYQVLKPGGRVVLTTPNVFTPGRYWKDATHCTPYHYEELGGLLLGQEFELLEICRMFNAPFLEYLLKVYVFSSLFRFLGIDYTKSIMVVAQKAPSPLSSRRVGKGERD